MYFSEFNRSSHPFTFEQITCPRFDSRIKRKTKFESSDFLLCLTFFITLSMVPPYGDNKEDQKSKTTLLRPICPKLHSLTHCHLNAEFDGSFLCFEKFFSGLFPVYLHTQAPTPRRGKKEKNEIRNITFDLQWKIIHTLDKSCFKFQLIYFQSDFWLSKPLPTAYHPKHQTLRGSNCNLAALSKATRTFSWQIEDSMYCTHRASREPISSCRDKNRKERFCELQSCVVASDEFSSNFTTTRFLCVTGN